MGHESKKLKLKKVPQKRMGVAQLEKIILEQRQFKDEIKFRHPLISKSHPMYQNQGGFPYVNNVSSSSSSGMIEPLSNQSFCANNYSYFQPDGDQMVGWQRSSPFSMENTSFNCNIPCRENPLISGLITDQKTKKFIYENRDIEKDFLTLGPPQSSPPLHLKLKEKLPSYQGQTRDASETEWSNRQPMHSFFPEAKTHGTRNGEVGEQVDLNLKL
ncbi:hypothetical protein L1987_58070 [Smallanthus sonchifolius]|uniref:Uncharacterized protein n=1 Tax=Smallanthus sonchifolius TaxID=185202 RepID=A0ACB9DFD4_9ASTR|nr:hypothetical protein L1987_58070 [Smallanthus sonchifolius]